MTPRQRADGGGGPPWRRESGRRGSRSGPTGTASLGGEQVEGRQAVAELLRAGRRRVHQLTAVEDLDLGEITVLASSMGLDVHRVPRMRFDALALTSAPQGVLARADPVVALPLDELASR
ncbi:MAG: RNA methyltransferase substrate-binding domain-containing protein, partial [Acidimicrobiales bacterium]